LQSRHFMRRRLMCSPARLPYIGGIHEDLHITAITYEVAIHGATARTDGRLSDHLLEEVKVMVVLLGIEYYKCREI